MNYETAAQWAMIFANLGTAIVKGNPIGDPRAHAIMLQGVDGASWAVMCPNLFTSAIETEEDCKRVLMA